MKTILLIMCMLSSCLLYSQDNSYNLFKINNAKTESSRSLLRNTVDDAVIMNLEKRAYTDLIETRKSGFTMTVPVSKTQVVYLNLERFEILTPDARIVERSGQGEKDLDLRNIILSYKGEVAGKNNSFVTMSFYNNTLSGIIKYDNESFVIGSMSDESNHETEDIVIYPDKKLKVKNDLRCGSDVFDIPEEITKTINKLHGQHQDNGTATLLDARIAIDVDFYTYGVYGNSVPNATAYALAVTSAASAVYCKDMNIKLTVGYLRVWTTQDPYTSNSGEILLDQFVAEWVATQGSVDRVVAHLISRRNSIDVGGIAYVGVLCNMSLGYGLSSVNGTINQLPAYSYDVVVVAHEIGHNFGSPHTHSCVWVGGPIDSCYIVEGGCYNGPSHPTVGTIMSYCDTEGGTVVMDFGQQPEALIRQRAENAGCISVSARPIFTAYPNGGETFRTLSSTKIFWGTTLTGTLNLEYSVDNGGTWNIIQNNVPAADREYSWTLPYIGTTTQARVRILNSSNPSEGDTSDTAFRILLSYNPFTVISPPNLITIETAPNSTAVNKFIWNSTGSHPSLRYKFKIRKLGAGAVDFIYTSDNGGTDTAITFRNSFLDTLATLIGTTGDSIRCSWRGWAYNGFDSAQSVGSFIVTLKRITVGINVISSIVPDKFHLENNYPNPFNPSTVIKFDVAKLQNVEITIYDMLGKEIENLVSERMQPGKYSVSFNAANYSSGVYYYKMETQDFIQTKKMLLIK
ncbi:MAG: M12 family metallo-peptidase [bacterium]